MIDPNNPAHFAEMAQDINREASKVSAAQSMVQAAMMELDAALQLNDMVLAETARDKTAAAFEAMLDARIGAHRFIRGKYTH